MDREQLELAIAVQERLRGVAPDAVIDATIAVLRGQLAGLEETVQRRRQVTILFADISGFTAMSEGWDAERVAQVINGLWTRLDDVIRAHGGRIDKHIGDAVMAMWGAEAAREDDPEQALRAALGLQHELHGFREQHSLALRLRVGVNTGPVLLGNVATTSEFTAIGDAVNVASRLEHAAPLDGVLTSHDTYRHVRGVFDVEALDPIVLRGKTEPIRVYVVQRAKERALPMATRGVEGVETNTVGRNAELARLCDEYDKCSRIPGVRLAFVVGDAGIGKSRLLYEFRNWIELRPEPVFIFTGRALLGQEGVVLGLMREVLATRFDVLQSDPPTVVANKLRAGLAVALSDDEAEVVGHWLGFEIGRSEAVARLAGSAEFAKVARAHLLAWFAAVIGDQPGVLLLEDLHWADDDTLELVAELVQRRDMHLLVVGLARPTLFERHPDWALGATRVELQALDPDASRELVAEVLQHAAGVPDELTELIVGRADGNPFYVEELVKMLIDDDVITVGDEWRIDLARLDPVRVPATLTGVLQARLDGLPAGERAVLQHAAVVGRIFWDGAIAALGQADRPSIATALAAARRRELVQRRSPSSFAECVEFIFKHALLRDVTYETVLHRDRPALHAAAARWLEAIAGERVAEYREVIAGHLELAGDAAGAAQQLLQSGIAAVTVGNATAAIAALQRAVVLWDGAGIDPDRAVYAPLSRALRNVGRLSESDAVASQGLASSTLTSDDVAQLHYQRFVLASIRMDRELEWTQLGQARAAVPADAIDTRSDIETGTAWFHQFGGQPGEAALRATEALQLALLIDDKARCAKAAAVLGTVAADAGDLVDALAHVERELAFATESGDLQLIASAQGRFGMVHHLLGDLGEAEHYEQAAALYESQIRTLRRLGAPHWAAYAVINLAQLRLRTGDVDATRTLLAESFATGLEPVKGTVVLCLQVDADRRITTGDTAGGLAIIGRIRCLPHYSAADENKTQRILSRVRLPADELVRLLTAGADLDLDALLAEIARG